MWFRSRFLSAQTGFAVGIAATAVEHTSDVFETAFQQASPRFDRERNVVSIGRQTDRLLQRRAPFRNSQFLQGFMRAAISPHREMRPAGALDQGAR
jgi:hypothetical protein